MKNRYLFRAKRTDNGEWIVGSLIQTSYLGSIRSWISSEQEDKARLREISSNQAVWRAFEVRTDTICQCTGLKRFFEKDIVERTDLHKVGDPSIGIIEYDVENTAFVIHWIDREKYSLMYPWKDKIKVSGNIFDNPELLEVGE